MNTPIEKPIENMNPIDALEDSQSISGESADLETLQSAGIGSVFEKTALGWNVKYVDGGTVIHVQGASIAAAVASHGAQRDHPIPRRIPGDERSL